MELEGYLDGVDHTRIFGWAYDKHAPECPVSLIVTCNGELLARVLANGFRADVQTYIGGSGRVSYDLDVRGRMSPLERNVVEVVFEVNGQPLDGSPRVLQTSDRLDGAMKAAIGEVLAAVHTEADLADRLAFLAEQTQALLALADRLPSRRNEGSARHRVKWRTAGDPEPQPPVAPRPAALVIDARMPVTERDAGSVAIVSHMLSLQRLGYAVTFLSADLDANSAALEQRDITCLTRPWYSCVEEALARHGGTFDVVYLHRAEVARPYLQLVRRYQPKAHVIFGVADLASLRIWRQAGIEERPELRAHSRFLAAGEIALCHQADAVITHSSTEATVLQQSVSAGKIHVVPFAVAGRATRVAFAHRAGLAFIGSFDHSPNADAARILAERIMPAVAKALPSLVCLLVGSAMPLHIAQLAGPTIVAVGAVDDLASIFDRVRLTIAPLAFGAGVKGKVLASLAAGIPCVCTPVAAEGLDLPLVLRDLIADSAEELAALVVRLHEDEDLNERCSQAGLEFIAGRGSEEAVDEALRHALPRA